MPRQRRTCRQTASDPTDFARLADVAEPAFTPDGNAVVYSVTVTNAAEDKRQSDLWRVRYDGSDRTQLTNTPKHDEWSPAWSPDGRWLAFLSDRGDEHAVTQVWAMPAGGGDARVLTALPGGVEEFAWSPDGLRLALIARDPDRPVGTPKPKNPPPIVTERWLFKRDITGYLDARRFHLYVHEIASGETTQVTSGPHDEAQPAWSPDGKQIAYVTRRGDEPDRHFNFDIYLVEPRAGATERQLTTFAGSDNHPDMSSKLAWSPDGKQIAYLQGMEDKWIYYATQQLAIVDVATGRTRIPAAIDRTFAQPHWSADGKSVLALIEQSRVTHLARIDVGSGAVTPLTTGPRFDADFAISPQGRIVVLGGDDVTPPEIAALERGRLRTLAAHNEWLAQKRLARFEDITFKSTDGTSIDGFVVKPLDYVAGRRYPTILRIHGGPVDQFQP